MFTKTVKVFVIIAFMFSLIGPVPKVQAQPLLGLPEPGAMVYLSPSFNPPVLKGIKVHPENPFRFDFILDKGDSAMDNDQLREESNKLIKYFLASLTIPEKDLWVNLSPYEGNRIVPASFGQTGMGRDLLAEDYMLKQITASLIYPESETGRKFWKRIYEESAAKFGTTNVPINTFNKVWIVPEKAVVYENADAGTAYVIESKLKVMLEQDYLSLQKHSSAVSRIMQPVNEVNSLGSQIVREIVIPQLTREVNEGRNFSQLRQVYDSLILAAWYKKKIKDSVLGQVYEDKNRIVGVNINDPRQKNKIYVRYLEAFKKGVYNYIKDDQDPITQEITSRKYFSGGVKLNGDYVATVTGSQVPEENVSRKDIDIGVKINPATVSRRSFLVGLGGGIAAAGLGGASSKSAKATTATGAIPDVDDMQRLKQREKIDDIGAMLALKIIERNYDNGSTKINALIHATPTIYLQKYIYLGEQEWLNVHEFILGIIKNIPPKAPFYGSLFEILFPDETSPLHLTQKNPSESSNKKHGLTVGRYPRPLADKAMISKASVFAGAILAVFLGSVPVSARISTPLQIDIAFNTFHQENVQEAYAAILRRFNEGANFAPVATLFLQGFVAVREENAIKVFSDILGFMENREFANKWHGILNRVMLSPWTPPQNVGGAISTTTDIRPLYNLDNQVRLAAPVDRYSSIKKLFAEMENGQNQQSPEPGHLTGGRFPRPTSTNPNLDRAMKSPGGIDLNYSKMNLQLQNAGREIKFHIDPAMLQELQNVSGFVPEIIKFQPMTDLRQFLGMQKDPRVTAASV